MLAKNLPTLDLHGENRDIASILIKDFISDNIKMGNKKIVIIHGIGTGIIRKTTYNLLRLDTRVDRFYIDMFNPGCTIVELKEDRG